MSSFASFARFACEREVNSLNETSAKNTANNSGIVALGYVMAARRVLANGLNRREVGVAARASNQPGRELTDERLRASCFGEYHEVRIVGHT